MKKKKSGGITLLSDTHFGLQNPSKNPVVGWLSTRQGVGGLYNPKGFAALRVVVEKNVDGAMLPLYDQVILVESPGAIAICTQGDRVGLVENFRMVGNRILPDAGAAYVERLDKEGLWGKLCNSLGQWKWECPRGLAPPETETADLERFVIQTAKIEAGQEAGFKIAKPRLCGWLNTNPTFFAHPQAVVHAEIEAIGSAKPEDLELIGKARLFTPQEIRAMTERGELDDGLTLAAMALAGYHF